MILSLLKDDETDSLVPNSDHPGRAFLLPLLIEPLALDIFIPAAELADYDIAIGLIVEFAKPLDITVLDRSK